jgi:hypothetical protein
LVAAALLLTALAATSAVAATVPTPLRAPTGYRDYCDGLRRTLCPAGRAPQALWRKLTLPAVAPGSACPVSATRRIPALSSASLASGNVLFSAGGYSHSGPTTAEMPFPATVGPALNTGWGLAEAPLNVPKSCAEPLVLRGRRLDGASEPLGFSHVNGHPYIAMQLAPGSPTLGLSGSWKGYGLLVWAATPGCYGLQVDGRTFSRTFVFRVAFLPTS